MSMATLEREVLAGARLAFKNPKLTKKNLAEWSTGEIVPCVGEVVVYVPDPGVYVAVGKQFDKRTS
jgi:hypothetical protein